MGGDFQAMTVVGNTLYASCHCTNYGFSDTTTYEPTGYSRVDPINYLVAFDLATNEQIPSFQPVAHAANGEGPWELTPDDRGCLWVGGDMDRGAYDSSGNAEWAGGFFRMCPRDSVAPTTPTDLHATASGADVVLSWNASTDDSGATPRYEVLRDDRVVATVYGTSFAETVTVPARYFVRAVDGEQNRSATTTALAVAPPPEPGATLVPAGSTWRYRADGVDLGATWRQPGYDTASWATGPAQLGWGDGDEATIVPSAAVTQYFVRTFTVANTATVPNLRLRLRRDDGAAVYVNGIEVGAFEPAGRTAHRDDGRVVLLMGRGRSRPGPTASFRARCSPPGPTRSRSSCIKRARATVTDRSTSSCSAAPRPRRWPRPRRPAWGSRAGPAPRSPWAGRRRPTRPGSSATSYAGTARSSPSRRPPPSSTPGWIPTRVATYLVSAFDPSGNESTAATIVAGTVGNPELVAFNASWRWKFDGIDPGPSWNTPGYDDTTWNVGAGELGMGDGDEATVIWNGGFPTPVTAYFRNSLDVAEPAAITGLTLDVVRDDGVAVYVNGVEVARDNLAPGAGPTTLAPNAVWTRADEAGPIRFAVPPALLHTGSNSITVEVHQSSQWSGDLSFALRLLAGSF